MERRARSKLSRYLLPASPCAHLNTKALLKMMQPIRLTIFLVAAAIALTACPMGMGNEELRAKLDNRAKFDLKCSDLQVVALEATNERVTSYGVTGCGHRVTYVLNAGTLSWVMNVSDGSPVETSAGAPTPASVPPK